GATRVGPRERAVIWPGRRFRPIFEPGVKAARAPHTAPGAPLGSRVRDHPSGPLRLPVARRLRARPRPAQPDPTAGGRVTAPPPPLVHFLEEQRRHRRTSALSAALVVVVLAVSGIPLSIVVSPFLVATAAVPVYLADLVFDVPEAVTGWLDRTFNLLPTMWQAVRRSDVDLPWDLLVALFVLPGLVAMLLLWAVVRVTFRGTGVGGVLRRMKVRPPRSGDLAEQRLANLVQEVAVAAGVPPPRVVLIDAKSANVGAAGLRMDDATVVVTRGFVDRLSRDEQQAVIAHVMASIGNGDLTLAAEILTLIQVWGLVSLVLEAPMVPAARASLKLVGRTAGDTLRGRTDAQGRELVVDTLL